ncbi:MAG: hypothetical protein HY913_15545 [Desulfomonile tiedjei]|nr:hypothetical protein [Desulfomonile tiedjei]
MQLYTAKDVERCYPWISAGTTNYRVKSGAIPLTHPSTGTGIPNMFTLPELVHCAVIDELASLGVFGNLHTTVIHYREPKGTNEKGEPITMAWDGSKNPHYVDMNFYERLDYRVIVEVELRHDGLYGSNLPRELILYRTDEHGMLQHKEGHGRFYNVTYSSEVVHEKTYIDMRLEYWLAPRKAKFNRLHMAKAFIRVRQLYDLAAETLGFPK